MRVPYAYHLYHLPTNQHYYGVEYGLKANPNNLWVTYFSSSKRIKNLIHKYGKESFKFKVRKIFKTTDEAIKWETKFLHKIDAKNNKHWLNQHNGNGDWVNKVGYLLTERQRLNRTKEKNPFFGKKHTDETRQKMRKPKSYVPPKSEETKKRLSESLTGRTFSETHKKNISKGKKGTIISEQTKQKISLATKGEKNPMFGKSAVKGGKWYTNGISNIFILKQEIPLNYKRGRTPPKKLLIDI